MAEQRFIASNNFFHPYIIDFSIEMTDEQVSQIDQHFKDIVNKIVNASGKNLSITHDLTKPSIRTKLALVSDKAKRELGWEPKVPIEDGISEILKHIDYWKDAPVWSPDSIAVATKDWFRYLS